jgi:hypothetical protein
MFSFDSRSKFAWQAVFAIAVALALLATATHANAACSDPLHSPGGQAMKLPFLAHAGQAQVGGAASIVGLWHVTYTADGALFYEAYDQWHADGNEFENADLGPIEGNICMGVWKKVAPRTVHLNHVGWNFDNTGNPNGSFTLTETNTVSANGLSYRGAFDYKLFDAAGNLLQEVTGTLSATRITAD